MKKLLVAFALTSVVCAAPVLAADVGITVRIGEPGFYGMLDIGNTDRPRLMNSQAVIVERRYRNLAPIYLRVPVAQQRNWKRYCDRYNACTRPVYFVRDDWYRDVYSPRYRKAHDNDNRAHDDQGHDNRGHDDHGRDDHGHNGDDRH